MHFNLQNLLQLVQFINRFPRTTFKTNIPWMIAAQPDTLDPRLAGTPNIINRMIADKQRLISFRSQTFQRQSINSSIGLADSCFSGNHDRFEVAAQIQLVDFTILDMLFPLVTSPST